MAEWAELSEDRQDVLIEEAEGMLSNLLYCTRDWNAWSVGTMTENDFIDATEDGGAEDLAKNLFSLIQKYSSGELI